MKFSIVIPVYNVEKYIDKCLNSILCQSYDNFEVIIVNDGTKDNSQKIIDKYVKKDKRFKSYIKKNGGLSSARNYGLDYVKGDYLLFVDSDDYIEPELLKKLFVLLNNREYDVVKFKLQLVTEDGDLIRKERGFNTSKDVALKEILSLEYNEPACTYCYNMKFWKKNNFKYAIGKIHEDFGLTPLVLYRANSIYYLDYYGYNYVQRMGSIVNGAEKNIRRVNDLIFHFDFLYDAITKEKKDKEKELIISFLANGLIYNAALLNGKDLKNYIIELRKRNIFNLILEDTFSRKIKKLLIKINPYLYIKYLLKNK